MYYYYRYIQDSVLLLFFLQIYCVSNNVNFTNIIVIIFSNTLSLKLRIFSDEETLLNTVNELYTSNNSILEMYNDNTGEIDNIYYISIIEFIISMNREIIYSNCLFCFVKKNNISSIIIITLINITIAIVTLM